MATLSSSKRILITGASRGIGRAAALALAAGGHHVIVSARDRAALNDLAATIAAEGGRCEVLVVDVTSDASVTAAIEAALVDGPIDVLVNNAGACTQQEFLRHPAADRRAEMELNYWGAQRVTEAVLPAMLRRRRGLIVNVSSLLGTIAAPTTANYSATKAALEAWSHGLRGEVARFGVQVTVFVAPHTDTEMGRRVKFDGVTSLPVAYTVKELLRAIDRAPRRYAASPVYRLLLRLAGLFPAFMERRVAASAARQLTEAGATAGSGVGLP